MWDRLFSIGFWIFVGISSVVCFVLASILWVVTTPFDRDRRINHMFSCAWGSLYVALFPFWRVRVLNRHHLAPRIPYVIVANHTSMADVVLCYTLFKQFKWVSKREVFSIPVLGWNMWMCRYIPLKRGDKNSAGRMLETCHRWLARGISVLMFPEGTRSRDGQLLPFRRGAFALALEAGVPVVPVAVHGATDLIPKHGRSVPRRVHAVLEVLPAMNPLPAETAESFAERIHAVMSDALAKQRHRSDEAESKC